MLIRSLINWWHHVTNPHCVICSNELHEQMQCSNCETLRSLLESEKFEKKELLNHLLGSGQTTTENVVTQQIAPESIIPKNIPWRVRREMLEAEDRAAVRLRAQKDEELKAQSQTTEELEKELGVG